jgi:hypothetical protein
MDRPVTEIYVDSLRAIQPIPPAPTPASVKNNVELTRGSKRDKHKATKNAVLDHAQTLHQGSSQSENLADQSPVTRTGSPWDTLKRLFTCDLAGSVYIAVHDKSPSKVVAVRAFSKKKADTWLQVLQRTRHPNVISAKEIFVDNGMTYFIVDDLPLTLENLVACDLFPSELQLASILVQV